MAIAGVYGCDGNERGLSNYVPLVLEEAGASLTLEQCTMFEGTRAGYCIVRGKESELDKIVRHFGLPREDADAIFNDSCLNVEPLGQKLDPNEEHGWKPRSGTERYRRGTRPLPPNQNNVYFRAFYIAPSKDFGCLEFEYPYG